MRLNIYLRLDLDHFIFIKYYLITKLFPFLGNSKSNIKYNFDGVNLLLERLEIFATSVQNGIYHTTLMFISTNCILPLPYFLQQSQLKNYTFKRFYSSSIGSRQSTCLIKYLSSNHFILCFTVYSYTL